MSAPPTMAAAEKPALMLTDRKFVTVDAPTDTLRSAAAAIASALRAAGCDNVAIVTPRAAREGLKGSGAEVLTTLMASRGEALTPYDALVLADLHPDQLRFLFPQLLAYRGKVVVLGSGAMPDVSVGNTAARAAA